MELRIDTLPGQTAPKDTFLSVRIGDVQKQSRFSPSRVYRFPDTGGGHTFGRIEVFQRVGHLTMSFNADAGQPQEVQVPCDWKRGEDFLGLRVLSKGKCDTEKLSKNQAKVMRQRLDAAQEYLAEHGLEELLAEAMREVISRRPTDPHDFLANHIQSCGAKDRKASDNTEVLKKASRPTPDPNEKPAKAVAPVPKEAYAIPPKRVMQPPASAPLKPALAKPGSLKYYNVHMKDAGAMCFDALHAKFPRKSAPKAVEAVAPVTHEMQHPTSAPLKPVAAKPGSREYYDAHMKDGGAMCFDMLHAKFPRRSAPKAVEANLNSRGYYQTHFLVGVEGFARLYSKFPQKSQPKPVPAAPEPTTSPFGSLPSVGTWFSPRLPQRAKVQTVPAAPELATSPFGSLPSVGTWFSPRLPQRAKVQTVPAAPELATSPFGSLPSVGTWFSPRLPQRAKVQAKTGIAAEAFCKLPSVGTWLAPIVVKAGEKEVEKEAPAAMASITSAVRVAPAAMASIRFAFMPSVGTWLATALPKPSRPLLLNSIDGELGEKLNKEIGHELAVLASTPLKKEEAQLINQLTDVIMVKDKQLRNLKAQLKRLKNARAAQGKKGVMVRPSTSNRSFKKRPSVGTWLASRPKVSTKGK